MLSAAKHPHYNEGTLRSAQSDILFAVKSKVKFQSRCLPNQKETVDKNLEEYSNQFYVAPSCLRLSPHNY